MSDVLASIVVHFDGNSSTDYTINHDLDDVENNDVTTFAVGQDIYFLIQHSNNVYIESVKPTNGQCFQIGRVSRDRTDEISFSLADPDNKPSVSYIPSGSPKSTIWFGNQGGPVKLDQLALTANVSSGKFPCLGRVTYASAFYLYRLTPGVIEFPEGEDNYTIEIHIYIGEK